MRARALLFVPTALLVFTLAACGGSNGSKSVPSNAVAIVGNQPITKAQLAVMLAASSASDRLKGQDVPQPGSVAYRAMRDSVLDTLVQSAEFAQKAKSDLGIVITNQQIDQQLTNYKHQYFGDSDARFAASLKQQGTTEAEVRQRLMQQALGDAIYAKLSSKVTVTNDDIEAYYKSHRSGYTHPAKRQVRHILLKTKAQADRIEQQLKQGADFATLAKQYSTDTSTRSAGGTLAGGITRGQTLPAFDQMAFSLKTNAISPPVHTQYGWHIIQATSDVIPQSVTPLAQVRSAISTQLLQQKKQNTMTAWINDAKTEYLKKTSYAAGYGPLSKTPNAAGQGG